VKGKVFVPNAVLHTFYSFKPGMTTTQMKAHLATAPGLVDELVKKFAPAQPSGQAKVNANPKPKPTAWAQDPVSQQIAALQATRQADHFDSRSIFAANLIYKKAFTEANPGLSAYNVEIYGSPLSMMRDLPDGYLQLEGYTGGLNTSSNYTTVNGALWSTARTNSGGYQHRSRGRHCKTSSAPPKRGIAY
jgi:hypothetical protein